MLLAFLFAFPVSQALESRVTTQITLDKPYAAMSGPSKGFVIPVRLPKDSQELWITGVKVEIKRKGESQLSPEFLCHSRLGIARTEGLNPDRLRMDREEAEINDQFDIDWFLGNSQGNLDNTLPEGFGIRLDTRGIRQPIYAVQLQADPNLRNPVTLNVSVVLTYADAEEARQKKLRHLYGFRFPLVEKGGGTWFVPPGRHQYKTGVRFFAANIERLPIHYIQPHTHAYTEWIELYDVTAGKSLWRGQAKTDLARGALTNQEIFSDKQGLQLNLKHKYEIRTEYNNTTDKPVDAMANLKMYAPFEVTYFLDEKFIRGENHQHH